MSVGLDGGAVGEALAAGMLRAIGMGASGGTIPSPLDPCENTKEFVDTYGLSLDGTRFDWDEYQHLVPVYEDDWDDIVLMAGAQTGKSARVMAGIGRDMLVHYGKMFGYFFPDYHLPRLFSTQRFKPFMRSSPELGALLGAGRDGAGQDAVLTRNLGESVVLFLSVAGKTATEGAPMTGLYLDEVRRMAPGDIQRAQERQSAQRHTRNMAVSTAYYPEADIHALFLDGDQRYFHTACDCPDGIVLSLTFPDCIADLSGATPKLKRSVEHAFSHAGRPYLGMSDKERHKYGDAVYLCPRCGRIIVNPRDGWWEPHNPGAYRHSYQMPQLLSPTFPAARCLAKYDRPGKVVDMQEIWNSMVGLPYIDRERQKVHPEHLLASINPSLKWPRNMSHAWKKANLKNTVMGVDGMGGYNCVWIKTLAPNGKARTVHLEVCHGDDPWARTAQLMTEFDVRVCVADCNPHWNESLRFAKAFEGRVWLATYDSNNNPASPMVVWKDKSKKKGERAAKEAGFKYMVGLSRTKALKWSLSRWASGHNETPPPDKLIQELPWQTGHSGGHVVLTPGLRVGRMTRRPIMRDVGFLHLQRVAFEKRVVSDEKRRMGVVEEIAVHVGIDPHFAHCNLYADAALARLGKPLGVR